MKKRILDMLAWLLVLIIFALGASACTTSGGSFCSIAKPIRLTGQTIAVMTDAEVAAVLAHNRKGEKLCGWKP